MTDPALTLARKKLDSGELMDALMALSDGLHKKPNDRDMLRARAHIFINLHNLEQAERDLDTLIKAHSNDALAWDDRGVLYQMRGDFLRAAECHMKAVDLEPSDGIVLNLAIAMNHLGQRTEAEKLYKAVIDINPRNTRAMTNLAVLHDERGNYAVAEEYLQKANALGDESFELCMTYGNICRKQERKDDALQWYEKARALRPDNGPAKFLTALMKGENPETPPQEHIAGLFDSYADNFENSLVGQLKYRTPELLFEVSKSELESLKRRNPNAAGIDLGAGTGLFGKILRPYLKTSIGLDLSIKMLQKAQEQNIYDDVLCMDMTEGLRKYGPDHFSVIAAADVFVYAGKLDEIFSETANALQKDGLFIFSTEALSNGEKGDYVARDTGRYAHDESYLKKLATQNDLSTVHFERTWIRYNKDKPLDGFIVILKKA